MHGSAPDKSEVALLLIDVINALDFPEAAQMHAAAVQMAHHLSCLKKRARPAGAPVMYVNDKFGRWKSDFRARSTIVCGRKCAAERSPRS